MYLNYPIINLNFSNADPENVIEIWKNSNLVDDATGIFCVSQSSSVPNYF